MMTPNQSPEPRRWRWPFRCRGSRRESAVAQLLFSFGNMRCSVILLAAVLTGCAHTPVEREAGDHYYRLISFPIVALKSEPLERIESVEVVMHCGRFTAINHIPSDWSAQVVSPVSEETKLRMEAGHGSSSLCRSSDLDGFITVLVCEPSCFDISASVSVFSYDTELHERTVSFKQSDLLMKPLPNKALQATATAPSS